MKNLRYYCLKLLLLLCLSTSLQAAVSPNDLLTPEEVFIPQIFNGDTGLTIEFAIADGYYLYQGQTQLETKPAGILGEPKFGAGKNKHDEFFGEQTVFFKSARIDVPYKEPDKPHIFTLTLTYQGCAKIGICYPPTQSRFHINGNGVFKPINTPANGHPFASSAQSKHDYNLSKQNLSKSLLTFFFAGIALSFTACMYPLLPIVSSIIVGNQEHLSKKRAFLLSFIYVQGLALSYTIVGIIAGLTGALLTVWLQQPWVILTAAFLLVILALAMFDVISLQMPASIQSYFHSKSQKLGGGKIFSVLIMGALSALIIGPCIAPPLAIALGYIGQTGNAFLGGSALYFMALGTGLPLIVIGTFGGHILPRAGVWMHAIKSVFGVLILGMAIYLASPFLPIWFSISLYVLLCLSVIIMLAWNVPKLQKPWQKMTVVLFSIIVASNTIFFISTSVTQTGSILHHTLGLHFNLEGTHPRFVAVDKLQAAIKQAQLQQPDKPVLLDFYADWCITCKQMQTNTFSEESVQKVLNESYQFMQIDVTEHSEEQQKLLKAFKLFGPPALFMLFSDGSHSEALLGYADPDALIKWLNQNNNEPVNKAPTPIAPKKAAIKDSLSIKN